MKNKENKEQQKQGRLPPGALPWARGLGAAAGRLVVGNQGWRGDVLVEGPGVGRGGTAFPLDAADGVPELANLRLPAPRRLPHRVRARERLPQRSLRLPQAAQEVRGLLPRGSGLARS